MGNIQYSKLQVPLKTSIKKMAEEVAEEYGYSSVQEVVRIFLTGFAQKKIQPSFLINNTEEYISPEYEAYLNKVTNQLRDEIKHGKAYTAHNADDIIKIAKEFKDD